MQEHVSMAINVPHARQPQLLDLPMYAAERALHGMDAGNHMADISHFFI
ncbi:hypothetical protein [Methylobacillus sp. MM3]|nr:hypothetical protein [Methylobacillus sp. MM3]